MLSNTAKIIKLALADVSLSSNSARIHPRAQRRRLKSSIARFGQVLPIIVDAKHQIIDGDAVYQALEDLGETHIDEVVAPNRSPEEIRALRLVLNRLPEDSKWDRARLKAEFQNLLSLSFDLEITGFEVAEIDALLGEDVAQANVIEDAESIPKYPSRPVTRLGDVWELGGHRIACGDALDPVAVATLCNGNAPTAAFCDPPYNVPIKGFASGKDHREFPQASGEMSNEEFTTFLKRFFKMLERLKVGGVAFVCIDWRHLHNALSAATLTQLELINVCVWAKTNAGQGSFYRSQHEEVLVFRNGSTPHLNNIELGRHGRHRSNLWTYRGLNSFGADRDELLASHPTVKPVALIADALRDVTRRKEIVLDLFLGSGSTLIAAEETGRRCYGMDLDPGYVDVAIERWQRHTGGDAVLASTGELFAEIAERVATIGEASHG